jgi:hypothetical protein
MPGWITSTVIQIAVPLPVPHGRHEWVALAGVRLRRVLRTRIAATIRQLEVKICESGPPNKRPEPHILGEALTLAIEAGHVRQFRPRGETTYQETVFYILAENYPEPARARIVQLLVYYRLHRMLIDLPEYCSAVMEDVVRRSFDAAGGYTYQGKQPNGAPLDGVYRHGTELIGVEVKNVREWVYPKSGRIWVMIRKCLELDAIPFLITRKVPYVTHSVFSRLGILSFEFYRQIFSPIAADLLINIRHTDQLGYKDVISVDAAPWGTLVHVLQNAVPQYLAHCRAQWNEQRDLLTHFAQDRGMGDPDMNDQSREPHYRAFARALFYRPEETQDRIEEEEPEEGDWEP